MTNPLPLRMDLNDHAIPVIMPNSYRKIHSDGIDQQNTNKYLKQNCAITLLQKYEHLL